MSLELILPIVLFVITLVIILAFRAEDRKSRSLQTVKDKISLFRTESQQTMARINETAKDAGERVDAKRQEVMDAIGDVDSALSRLSNHRNDLMQLEAICRGYESALEKLRVQTEHAEDRIHIVQSEVEKAEGVHAIIESFHNDVDEIRGEMATLVNSCALTVQQSEEDLKNVARNHKAQADEMLSDFTNALSRNREEVGVFFEDIKTSMDERRDDFVSYVNSSVAAMEEKKADILEETNSVVAAFRDERASFDGAVQEANSSLAAFRDEVDTFHSQVKSELDEDRTALAEERERTKSDASLLYENLESELKSSAEAIKNEIANVKETLDGDIDARKDELASFLEEVKARFDADRTLANETLEENKKSLDEQLAAIKTSLENELASFETALEEKKSELASTLADAAARMEEEKKKLGETVAEQEEKLDAFLSRLESSVSTLAEKKAELEREGDELEKKSQEVYADFANRLNDLSSATSTAQASMLMEGENNLQKLYSDLKAKSEADSREIEAQSAAAKAKLVATREEQQKLLDEEELKYVQRCREDLLRVMNDEVERVSAIYDRMMQSSTEQLSNFARKLTEIKEAVSMLNQGVNDSLSLTGEKLNQIQSRMANGEASLNETQSKVTASKEELFNLQQQHKRLQDEVTRAQKELDFLTSRAQTAKKERQSEEARLAKLQMETSQKAKSASSAVKESKKSFDDQYIGEEESILLDDED